MSEAVGSDIEALSVQRGHRTLAVVRKGGKKALVPLAPRTARAIDLTVGERCEGPVYHLLAGEAKAAGALFDPERRALEIGEAAAMGATIFLITGPESLPREVLSRALAAAESSGLELFELTGQSLTSDMPMTYAVLPPPDADDTRHPEGDSGPNATC